MVVQKSKWQDLRKLKIELYLDEVGKSTNEPVKQEIMPIKLTAADERKHRNISKERDVHHV